MRLQEIVEILKNTELKQVVVGEDESLVIGYLNLALIDIYARLNVLVEEQIIIVNEGQTRYRLQDNSQKVIQVMMWDPKWQQVPGDDQWEEVPVNDIHDNESVFTPQPYVLHIPNPENGRKYSVMQVVSPPYITKENINTVDFIVPPQFMEAIVSYVGYRAYKSVDGSEPYEWLTHYKNYDRAINELLKRGLNQQSIMTNTKLIQRGYR